MSVFTRLAMQHNGVVTLWQGAQAHVFEVMTGFDVAERKDAAEKKKICVFAGPPKCGHGAVNGEFCPEHGGGFMFVCFVCGKGGGHQRVMQIRPADVLLVAMALGRYPSNASAEPLSVQVPVKRLFAVVTC